MICRATWNRLCIIVAASVSTGGQEPASTLVTAASTCTDGLRLVQAGDLGRAIAALEACRAADSRDPSTHYILGAAYSRAGRDQEALRGFEEAVRLQPNHADARYALSAICSKKEDFEGVVEQLQAFNKITPSHADARFNLGLALARQGGREREAIRELRIATQIRPTHAGAFVALGELYSERNDHARAVECLEQAVTIAPKDAEAHYNLGLALRLAGELDRATAELETALQLDENHGLAQKALGLIFRQKGEYAKAEVQLRAAAAHLSEDTGVRATLGNVLLQLQDLEGALHALRESIRLNPYSAEAHYSLAQALSRTGNPAEASVALKEAQRLDKLKRDAGRSILLVQSAEGAMRNGDVQRAVSDLRSAVQISPEYAEAHLALAQALRTQQANSVEEELHLRKVLELKHDQPLALYQLGLVMAARGRSQQALELITRSAHLRPSSTDTKVALGRLMRSARRPADAAEHFRAALSWRPASVDAQRSLGAVLNEAKQWQEAELELLRALQLAPSDPEATFQLGIACRGLNRAEEANAHFAAARRLGYRAPMVAAPARKSAPRPK